MEITKDLLKCKFDEYNKAFFNGKLGKCVFSMLPANVTYFGMFTVKRDNKGNEYGRIRLGNCVEWTEEIMQEVLLHEMVHMYNLPVEGGLANTWPFNGLFWHGFFFKRQCRRVKRRYGVNIPVNITVFKPLPYKNKKHNLSFVDRVFSRILGC